MSTAVAIQRSPELIAAEINHIKNQTRATVLYNSIEIGRRLCEAKDYLPHGEWGNWLEESVDYSQSTANNLMRIFEEYGADQLALFGETGAKSQALGSLSYTQAVALLALPADEREEFIEGHDLDSMSTRELQKVVKELEEERKQNKNLLEIQEGLNSKVFEAEESARHNKAALDSAQRDIESLKASNESTRKEYEDKYIKQGEHMTQMRHELAAAKAAGNTEEAERLQTSLTDAQSKIKELEEELKSKPIDVPAVVEKIPDDVEKELESLRAGQRSAAEIKFKLEFDTLVKDFSSLLTTLAEIEEESLAKYKGAVSVLIGKMSDRL